MAIKWHEIDWIFDSLEEEEKTDILRDAGIPDTRPGALGGSGGSFEDGSRWMEPRRKQILPLLLRRVNISNFSVRRMVREGDFPYPAPRHRRPTKFRFSLTNDDDSHSAQTDRPTFRVTDLAAASAFASEMFVILGGANVAISTEESVLPPKVAVSKGSIELTIGSGLFASGLGLIVACAAGLVAAPIVGVVAGATLSSVGIIELAIDWKKKIAEIDNIREETRVLRLKHDEIAIHQSRRLQALEIRKKELELQQAIVEQQEMSTSRHGWGRFTRDAHSDLVPHKMVKEQAKLWDISEEYALHILNRGLPAGMTLTRYFRKIKAKPPSEDD